jgi:hypothetical protein
MLDLRAFRLTVPAGLEARKRGEVSYQPPPSPLIAARARGVEAEVGLGCALLLASASRMRHALALLT